MPTACCQTPIGFAKITEEDGFIISIYLLDQHCEPQPAASALLQKAINQLGEYFEGKRKLFDLPLRLAGSKFQRQVWEELLKIPYGKTISYAQQSNRMKNPSAIRAVASANGKNKLIIVVPCHRVIGADGSLTGFGAGLWRKQWLLEHESRTLGIGQAKLNF